jgi:hypothetical protein
MPCRKQCMHAHAKHGSAAKQQLLPGLTPKYSDPEQTTHTSNIAVHPPATRSQSNTECGT